MVESYLLSNRRSQLRPQTKPLRRSIRCNADVRDEIDTLREQRPEETSLRREWRSGSRAQPAPSSHLELSAGRYGVLPLNS